MNYNTSSPLDIINKKQDYSKKENAPIPSAPISIQNNHVDLTQAKMSAGSDYSAWYHIPNASPYWWRYPSDDRLTLNKLIHALIVAQTFEVSCIDLRKIFILTMFLDYNCIKLIFSDWPSSALSILGHRSHRPTK